MADDPKETPSIMEFPKWCAYHVKRDWPTMKKAPLGFTAFAVLVLIGFWAVIWHVVVPEKDEQLRSKQGVIEEKDATIQQLQTTLAVNGLNTFPLKKRVNTLADQIDKFADNFTTNNFNKQMIDSEVFGARFVENGRVSRIISECDEQGAHVDGLDNHAPVWEALANTPTKPEAIHNLAALLRELAGKLKD